MKSPGAPAHGLRLDRSRENAQNKHKFERVTRNMRTMKKFVPNILLPYDGLRRVQRIRRLILDASAEKPTLARLRILSTELSKVDQLVWTSLDKLWTNLGVDKPELRGCWPSTYQPRPRGRDSEIANMCLEMADP